MEKCLGVITIGQSPRDDMILEMEVHLGRKTEIVQTGALDDLSYDEIISLNQKGDDNVLITKLRDGRAVNVVESVIFSRVQDCIYRLEEENVDLILLLCTGVFSKDFVSNKPIIYPQKLLHRVVENLLGQGKTIIVTPEEDQTKFYQEKWSKVGENIFVIHGSPYGDSKEVDKIISQLDKHEEINLIVLDCMGYNQKMKNHILKKRRIPVILAKTLVARVIGEMLNSGE